ncbi:hypothetical protein KIN20_035848 [Parelaphostrongylus tenuis]|uniref:Uncharacterized protein n=1 Tax=Parelaphostrongylus tenuis TaxID=148309 RepID=A0AAD5RC21_PARTN|nr:hypothetical protein KIN20_035848 [Parelaphostrongylus tenuis]
MWVTRSVRTTRRKGQRCEEKPNSLRKLNLENGTSQVARSLSLASCCAYGNPGKRLLNESAKFLLLDFAYGQNPRYFTDYLSEIRNLLRFSAKIRREGKQATELLQLNNEGMLCIHIRMTDFTRLNVSTNFNKTIRLANKIAKQQIYVLLFHTHCVIRLLFQMVHALTSHTSHIKGGAVHAAIVSDFDEVTDLYLASQVCQSFLITAPTSTFGWWLAFFHKGSECCVLHAGQPYSN